MNYNDLKSYLFPWTIGLGDTDLTYVSNSSVDEQELQKKQIIIIMLYSFVYYNYLTMTLLNDTTLGRSESKDGMLYMFSAIHIVVVNFFILDKSDRLR